MHFALFGSSVAHERPTWSVQEAYEALQEGFEALQSTSKHSQYVTIVCVDMILFQNAFFNNVSSENNVFAVPRKDQKAFLGALLWRN